MKLEFIKIDFNDLSNNINSNHKIDENNFIADLENRLNNKNLFDNVYQILENKILFNFTITSKVFKKIIYNYCITDFDDDCKNKIVQILSSSDFEQLK